MSYINGSRGITTRAARALLIVLGGSSLGAAGAVAGATLVGAGTSAYAVTGTCSNAAGAATITFKDGSSDTLSIDSSTGELLFDGASCTGSSPVASIDFKTPSTVKSASLILDDTASTFNATYCPSVSSSQYAPSTDVISVSVKDYNGGEVNVGSSGISFYSGTTPSQALACTLSASSSTTTSGSVFTGIASYSLVGSGQDSLGSAGTDGKTPTAIPTTFVLGNPGYFNPAFTSPVPQETVDPGIPGVDSLDLSQVSGCSYPCDFYVNPSASSQSSVPGSSVLQPGYPGEVTGSPIAADTAVLNSVGSNSAQYFSFASSYQPGAVITGYTPSAGYQTTMWSPPTSYSFGGPFASASQLISLSTAGTSLTYGSSTTPVSGSGIYFNAGTGTDTAFASGAGNHFVANSGSDTFYDTAGGNTVDFSAVATGANAELTINASGQTQSVGTSTLPTGQASVPGASSSTIYTFLDGQGKSTANNFTSFTGSSSGNTVFIGGDTGGLSFNGVGSNNAAQFAGTASGIIANLDDTAPTGRPVSGQLTSGGVTVSSTLLPGQVLVNNGTAIDTLAGIYNVTGPAIGYSTFYVGSAAHSYTFVGQGTASTGGYNSFFGYTATGAAPGAANFSSGGEHNKYFAGPGSETLAETSTSQSPSNTIDFGHATDNCTGCSLTINVSGAATTVPNDGAAVLNGSSTEWSYSFGNGGSEFTILKGASTGNTTFDGGNGPFQYLVPPSTTGNVLDFSHVSNAVASTLSLDVSSAPATALLGAVPESFSSSISTLIGLPGGNTTFIGGSAGGYNFDGLGSGNAAAFSTQVTANLTAATLQVSGNPLAPNQVLLGTSGSCATTGCDQLTDIANVSTKAGGSYFYAGSSSGTFGDTSSAGGDTLDFTNVPTASGTPLRIDVSNGPAGGTATLGSSTTYTFTNGTANFTRLIGSANGYTTFVGSPNGGITYTAKASNNSIDFSAAPSSGTKPLTIDFTQPCSTSDPICAAGGYATVTNLNAGATNSTGDNSTDLLTNLFTVVGSASGNNKFLAGPGAYNLTGNGDFNQFIGGQSTTNQQVFSSSGNHNSFVAGQSNESFNDAGNSNTVDLSKLTGGQIVVNVTGGLPVGSTSNNTASFGSYTYNFTSFASTPATFIGGDAGSPSFGTTFYAGSVADTFEGQGTPKDLLSFVDASGSSLTATVGSQLSCTSIATMGVAQLGSVSEAFCGIPAIEGLNSGNTTFVGAISGVTPTVGYSFTGHGSGNTATFANSPVGITADLFNNTVSIPGAAQIGAATGDTLASIGSVTGSATAANDFVAGITAGSFNAASSGNTLDLSHAQTSSSTPLVVNASGGQASSQPNGTAVDGSIVYNFTPTLGTFTSFLGSSQGNTRYLVGNAGGYTFDAAIATPGNVIDFSAVPFGVTVDCTADSPCSASWSGATDTVDHLTNFTGSSLGANTFKGGSLSYTFDGPGNNNTFDVGPGSETITDPGTNNRIDFANAVGFAGDGLFVNVSGLTVGTIPTYQAAVQDPSGTLVATYTFGSSNTTTFSAALAGPTTYYGGGSGYTYNGVGSQTATLDFSKLTSTAGPLAVCVAANTARGCGADQVLLGTAKESFNGFITQFDGLPNGSTSFYAVGTGANLTFNGFGSSSTNVADFSASATGITAHMDLVQPAVSTAGITDLVSDVSTVVGSSAASNSFFAGSAAQTFVDNGSGHADNVDFTAVPTSSASPLVINVSNATAVGVPSGAASAGGITYTLGGNLANFTRFAGSGSGNTRFIAPNQVGGYQFAAKQGNNTADFSASTVGVVANLSPTDCSASPLPSACAGMTASPVLLSTNAVYVGGSGTVVDTISGINTFIGSPNASNTFYGGLTGVSFQSTSGTNTLSYIGSSSPVQFDVPHSQVNKLTSVGTDDTYSLPGQLILQGSPGSDTFRLGTPATTIEGGGGADAIDLGALTSATVDLVHGTVSSSGANGTVFSPDCSGSVTQTAETVCVSKIIGSSAGGDTYTVDSKRLDGGTPLSITGSGAASTLDLSNITDQTATVTMPINSLGGTVTGNTSQLQQVTFTGVSNLTGTGSGSGDHVNVGTGQESITGTGSAGVLDFSHLPAAPPAGVQISVSDNSGMFVGSASGPAQIGSPQDTFSGFARFIGTPGADTFTQTGPAPAGGYFFAGMLGTNSVSLSPNSGPTITNLTAPDNPVNPADAAWQPALCSAGVNNDGTLKLADGTLEDTFGCVANVAAAGSTYDVGPGQAGTINGGGSGNLVLVGAPAGQGALVNLQNGQVSGPAGYTFTFSGMSSVTGTPNDDTFIDGPANISINGGGGSDVISFAGAPAAASVNLSSNPFVVPSGFSGAGTTLLAGTAVGGYGGNLTLSGISSAVGTTSFSDLLVAASTGVGSLTGGNGSDRFVLTGGFDYLSAGAGSSTLDLSQLPGQTGLDLSLAGPQNLGGAGDGGIWILDGNITTVIASPGGSALLGGVGNVTLQGGPGNDTLVAGTGTQNVLGGGGTDLLVGGVGTDLLAGGSSPVTFKPGQGSDTLTSPVSGNTLSYSGAPSAVKVNLTGNPFSIPTNEPYGGQYLPAQTASGGWGATVNLGNAGITNVTGTGFGDIFMVGNNSKVNGVGGNDLFVVDGGGNTLTAGSNTKSTFLFASGGSNVINGGGKSTVDFSLGTQSVNVNLQSGSASGGFASSSQQLSGILNIVGTNFADVLVAGGSGAVIDGLGAVCPSGTTCGDFLQAGPTGGDTLEANSQGNAPGNTTFCAEVSCAASGTTAGGGDTMIGGSGNDVFFARNGEQDIIYGEAGYNEAQVDTNDIFTGIDATF